MDYMIVEMNILFSTASEIYERENSFLKKSSGSMMLVRLVIEPTLR